MKYEIAIQPDTEIIIGDTIYNVSSSELRSLSIPFSNLLDTRANGPLKLSATEDTQAFLYFLQSAHGTFVSQEVVTSSDLTELARILGQYGIQPNTPPYDLVQFCFTRRTLQPARLTPLDLSRMLSVARVLGNTHVKQLLLQIFQFDSSHQEVDRHHIDVQTISLLANVILKRNNLCVAVGLLLSQSASAVSRVATDQWAFAFMTSLSDVANATLIGRPSPSRMRRLLSNIFVPPNLEIHVEKEQALRVIMAACNEVDQWLTSELMGLACETQSQDNTWGSFEQLELSETDSLGSELVSKFEDFDDDGVVLSGHDTSDETPDHDTSEGNPDHETGEGTPGRSQTM